MHIGGRGGRWQGARPFITRIYVSTAMYNSGLLYTAVGTYTLVINGPALCHLLPTHHCINTGYLSVHGLSEEGGGAPHIGPAHPDIRGWP